LSQSSTSEKKTYRCFVCEKNGFQNVQVVLGGKDQNGRTIYKEPDGRTPHQHKLKQEQQQQQQQQAKAPTITREEVVELKANINEIKEMLQRYQTYYGDLIEFMHKLTIGQQQERDTNEQLAEQEYNYDRDKEDGII
jgi:hypothetical protein